MDCFKWGICFKKFTVCVLALALIFGSGFNNFTVHADNTANGQGAGFSDVEGHWAKEQIEDWSGKGLVSGYDDGTFKPERGVTRAEFITFVNRAYGLTAKVRADFSDVSPQDWFAEEVAKAVAAGYISGYDDGTMRPAAEISRLEAAVILYKVLRLGSLDNERWVAGFNDSGSIAAWGREYVNSAVAGGYFSGYPDGTFKPDRVITRAETVALLGKAVGTLYNAQGIFGPEEGRETAAGNVTVSVSGVTLQNLVIEGDLFLTAGIGDGDFEADGVVVKGRTVVSGGGEESVVFNNTSLEEVIVYVVDGKVRIVAKGDTDIGNVVLESGAFLQEEDLTGDGFGDVQVLVIKPGESIELEGDFDSVKIETAVKVSITGDTRIKKLEVYEGAEGTKIDTEKDAVIETLTLDGAADVTGQGTIKTAYINTDDYSFDKEPEKIVTDGKKVGNEKKSSGGGGGGDDEDEEVQVSDISVEGVVKVGEELTATPTPSGATVSYQWQIADAEDSTYTNITGATSSIYKLVSADLGKYIKVRATGTGYYKGTVESKPVGPVVAATLSMADPSEDVIGTVGWTRFAGTVEVAEGVENINAYYIFEVKGDLATGTVPQYYHYETEEWLNFADLGEGKYRFGPEGGFPLTADLPLKGQTEFQAKFEDENTVTTYLVNAETKEIISNVIEETLEADPTLPATISMVDPKAEVAGTPGWTRFAGTVKVAESVENINTYYIFEITEGNLAEGTVLQYYHYTEENWLNFDVVEVEVGENAKYRFGPSSGFDLSTVDDVTTEFQVKIGSESITGKAYLVNAEKPEEVISNVVEATITYAVMEIEAEIPKFTVGVPQTFTVRTIPNDDAGKMVRAHFTLPDDVTVEYQEGGEGDWIPLVDVFGPEDGFPLGDITTTFRGTFAAAGEYTVTVEFKEVETDKVLGSKEITATVREYVSMEVSAEVESFTVDEQQEFVVKTVANDDADRMVRAYFDIPEQATVEYQEQQDGHPDEGEWFPLDDVFGPSTGFPVMDVDDSKFRATFDTAGDYTITIEFREVDSEEVLATYEMEVTVVVPEFNGTVCGQIITDEEGEVSSTLGGDFDVEIEGTVSEYTENTATFDGTVTGDIEGEITATINAMGIDTLYGTVENTGAEQTVRIIGYFPQSGTPGDFVGKVITGAPLPAVSKLEINGDSEVAVGGTLQLSADIEPEGATDRVLWSVWVKNGDGSVFENASEFAEIDKDGKLTAQKAGTVTVIAKTLDDRALSHETKVITIVDNT